MSSLSNVQGRVVKLDRGYPLVRLDNGDILRCEHATALVKGKDHRASIGDIVDVSVPSEHDKGIIEKVLPRSTAFVRRDPAERTTGQVLAANFNLVIVVEPIDAVNVRRLERELVLAHETGAQVAVVLSKADLLSEIERQEAAAFVKELAGPSVMVLPTAKDNRASLSQVKQLIAANGIAILVGKSGVGKSSLVNALVGSSLQDTTAVRAGDGKGRHTTVDRVLVELSSGGAIVDMPGIRGLGVWEVSRGLEVAFPDVTVHVANCRFRDCSHEEEPGCAVREAVASGELSIKRLESYKTLLAEVEAMRQRRAEASHRRGEKASDRKKH